ncbi:VOC family protein [Streptomyces sp. NPDC048248]|uniref:VOC family protein n=1 Tax=Streptomyces sp. NPDC048248 TaxID=3365523 RepID=UPI00371D8EB3
MSETAHSTPARGAPCWANLVARDLRATQEFYAAVLGWSYRPGSLGEEFSVALLDGQPVAGIGALAQSLQVPVAWTPYFAVESADDTADRIRERGATMAVGPLALGKGRAGLAADRDGAVFGFWEGEVLPWSVGQGKAPAMVELRTRAESDAATFYGEVFDWSSSEQPGTCTAIQEDGRVVVRDGARTVAVLRGGGIAADPDPKVRPRWSVHFPVDDLAQATAAAVDAGGTVTPLPATDSSTCRARTVIRDPDGGLFTVCTI